MNAAFASFTLRLWSDDPTMSRTQVFRSGAGDARCGDAACGPVQPASAPIMDFNVASSAPSMQKDAGQLMGPRAPSESWVWALTAVAVSLGLGERGGGHRDTAWAGTRWQYICVRRWGPLVAHSLIAGSMCAPWPSGEYKPLRRSCTGATLRYSCTTAGTVGLHIPSMEHPKVKHSSIF